MDNRRATNSRSSSLEVSPPLCFHEFICRAQCDSHRKRERKINPIPCFLQEKREKNLFKSCTSSLLRKICSLQKAAAKVCYTWGVIRVSLTCWRRNQQSVSLLYKREENVECLRIRASSKVCVVCVALKPS